MYRADNNQLIFSATDLVDFLYCEHLTRLELDRVRGLIPEPERDEAAIEVLRNRGREHENRYLRHLLASGRDVGVVEHPGPGLEALHAADAKTVAAMQRGQDVIYQAALFDGQWLGYADFLLRVETPSALGSYSYEVADTKLARTVKGSAIVQMCSYAEHLQRVQGTLPELIHVVLGDMRTESHRLRDYFSYYSGLKSRFLETALSESIGATYPDPIPHCSVCRWADVCDLRRRDDDHLSLVARMRRDQIRKLASSNITTVAALATTSVAPRSIAESTFESLRSQARLQVQQRTTGNVSYELLPPAGGIGLSLLPEPSPGDLFFDMEGDPFAEEGGLEYLFGVVSLSSSGMPLYQTFWAHTRQEERIAFESFIDFVMERLERYPDLHVYHYAPYEPNTLKRLMGVHATRETQIDQLLRGQVFVDLFQVVRQGVRVSQESYGLKALEPLYMPARSGSIRGGGDSIIAYERFLETHDAGLLAAIASYNQDDCESTWRLRDWLEERRLDLAGDTGVAIPRPDLSPAAASEDLRAAEIRVAALTLELSRDVPEDASSRTPEQQAGWLLGQLLHWHRREDKPEWWAYFKRLSMTDEELFDDAEAISCLSYVGVVGESRFSLVHRYRFDPSQEHKLPLGRDPVDPRTQRAAGQLVALDAVTGTLDLKRSKTNPAPHPTSLIPAGPIDTVPLRQALERVAEYTIAHGIGARGPNQSARDLLLRKAPRLSSRAALHQPAGPAAGPTAAAGVSSPPRNSSPPREGIPHPLAPATPLRLPQESASDAARRLIPLLDSSYLAIQGPPGSGKTFTGALAILDLLRAGYRVGITGPSHRAICNLLSEVLRHAARSDTPVRALQRAPDVEKCPSPMVHLATSNEAVAKALAEDTADLLAGTAWLFARPELFESLDYLFVDEAGQVSLANTVAIAGAARNLVLLGDPQQLSQPLKGTHPPGSEASALSHVLGSDATIGPEQGLLLDQTFRMHASICAYISEIAYDNRLTSAPSCAAQSLEQGVGLRYIPVEHEGNRTSSSEEAQAIATLLPSLLAQSWTNHEGQTRQLSVQDILVVAPYNAQVALLSQLLPPGSRVGTVDKFQGQEAPIVIFSTAASSALEVPRGLEFLFSLNRLNVAISRARVAAYLVSSPKLLHLPSPTPERMKLANAFCRYVELAKSLFDSGWIDSKARSAIDGPRGQRE